MAGMSEEHLRQLASKFDLTQFLFCLLLAQHYFDNHIEHMHDILQFFPIVRVGKYIMQHARLPLYQMN